MEESITQEIIKRLGLTSLSKISQFAVEARYKRNGVDGISDFKLHRIIEGSINKILEAERQRVIEWVFDKYVLGSSIDDIERAIKEY